MSTTYHSVQASACACQPLSRSNGWEKRSLQNSCRARPLLTTPSLPRDLQVLMSASFLGALCLFSSVCVLCAVSAFTLPIETKGRALQVSVLTKPLGHFKKSLALQFFLQTVLSMKVIYLKCLRNRDKGYDNC